MNRSRWARWSLKELIYDRDVQWAVLTAHARRRGRTFCKLRSAIGDWTAHGQTTDG